MPSIDMKSSSASLTFEESYESHADIWPSEVEMAFLEAYELYPSTGRTKIKGQDGKLYGRNELISKYIYKKTGKIRTRKQVSSHIQVLIKKHNKYMSPKPLSLREAQKLMEIEQRQREVIRRECPLSPPITNETLSAVYSPGPDTRVFGVYNTFQHRNLYPDALVQQSPISEPASPTSSRKPTRSLQSHQNLRDLGSNPSLESTALTNHLDLFSAVAADPMDMLLSAAILMEQDKLAQKQQLQQRQKHEDCQLSKGVYSIETGFDAKQQKLRIHCLAAGETDYEVTIQLIMFGETKVELRQYHTKDAFLVHLNPIEDFLTNALRHTNEDEAYTLLKSLQMRFLFAASDDSIEQRFGFYMSGTPGSHNIEIRPFHEPTRGGMCF